MITRFILGVSVYTLPYWSWAGPQTTTISCQCQEICSVVNCIILDIQTVYQYSQCWHTTLENVPSDMCAQWKVVIACAFKIFTGRTLKSKECKVSSCRQRRLWADCAYAQNDLNSCLRACHGVAHVHDSRLSPLQSNWIRWKTSIPIAYFCFSHSNNTLLPNIGLTYYLWC